MTIFPWTKNASSPDPEPGWTPGNCESSEAAPDSGLSSPVWVVADFLWRNMGQKSPTLRTLHHTCSHKSRQPATMTWCAVSVKGRVKQYFAYSLHPLVCTNIKYYCDRYFPLSATVLQHLMPNTSVSAIFMNIRLQNRLSFTVQNSRINPMHWKLYSCKGIKTSWVR